MKPFSVYTLDETPYRTQQKNLQQHSINEMISLSGLKADSWSIQATLNDTSMIDEHHISKDNSGFQVVVSHQLNTALTSIPIRIIEAGLLPTD